MKRLIAIYRLITKKHFVVLTWDYSDTVFVNAQYRQQHKGNELINDVVEAIWKQEYEKGK